MNYSCFLFQSTLPQGERREEDRARHWQYVFQSTLPQGERRLQKSITSLHWNFNPRSHKGSDFFSGHLISKCQISIHAPTRGATMLFSRAKQKSKFQSTLPQGERHSGNRPLSIQEYFNPRSHKGSDYIHYFFSYF